MKDYVVTVESTVDLSEELLSEYSLDYVPYSFNLNHKDYLDDYGKSLAISDFYNAMRDGATPTTSQVSIGRYIEFFKEHLKECKKLVHICMSSGISGSYNSACLAARTVMDEDESVKIEVVDSLCASSGYGFLAIKAAKMSKELSFDELVKWLYDNRLCVQHWFFPSDLTYLVRGGRVSKVAGIMGNALHICPLMNVDFEGHLIPRAKIRGKKKVMQAQVEKMKELCDDGIDYHDDVYICNSDAMGDVEYLIKLLKETFPNIKEIKPFSIGTVIGSHTGPGTVGLFFMGQKRID